MLFSRKFSAFLEKNKEGMDFDTFYNRLTRNIELSGFKKYNSFEKLANYLYGLDSKEYSEFRNLFIMDFMYVNSNMNTINKVLENPSKEEVKKYINKIFDLKKDQMSIVTDVYYGFFPKTTSQVDELNNFIDNISDDNEVVEATKTIFEEKCGQYIEDEYLGEYYLKLKNDSKLQLLTKAREQLGRIIKYAKRQEIYQLEKERAEARKKLFYGRGVR